MRVLIPSCTDSILQKCLESMERMEPGSTASVIVGNNGLHPDFHAQWPGVKFIDVEGSPFVYANAINQCAMAAGEHDLLIMGDDTEILTPGWFAITQACIGQFWPQDFGLLNLTEKQPDKGYSLDYGGGFLSQTTLAFVASMIPRRIWNVIGPMDETFTGYGWDDTDYQIRLLHAGYRIGILGSVMIRHEGTVSYRRMLGTEGVRELSMRNFDRFHNKWGLVRPEPREMKFLPAAPHFKRQECLCGSGERLASVGA